MTRAKSSNMDNTSATTTNSISGGTSVGGGVGVNSMGRAQMNCSSVAGGGAKEKMTATNTNSSNTTGATGNYSTCSSGGGGGGVSPAKNHSSSGSSTGNQPAFPVPAEHLPKLKSILPVATQCIYTPCYW